MDLVTEAAHGVPSASCWGVRWCDKAKKQKQRLEGGQFLGLHQGERRDPGGEARDAGGTPGGCAGSRSPTRSLRHPPLGKVTTEAPPGLQRALATPGILVPKVFEFSMN